MEVSVSYGQVVSTQATPAHSFLVLPENRFAFTAARRTWGEAAAAPPGGIVTLIGPPGVGKSHLLRETTRCFTRGSRGNRVAQVSGRELAERLRRQLAAVDLLACEDLHTLPGHDSIQQQLVRMFDEVTGHGGWLLFTSPLPPGELRNLSPKLVNRCHGGVTAEIGLPDEASRLKLLTHFAEAGRTPMPPDVLQQLASTFAVSGRELLSLLLRLVAISNQTGGPPGPSLVDRLFDEDSAEHTPASIGSIAKEVARGFNVTVGEIRSDSRARRTLIPRQTAMLLAREFAEAGLSEIGEFFGGRNHSTVVHACRRAEQTIADNQEIATVVGQIRRRLRPTRNTARSSRKHDENRRTKRSRSA